jgi:gamma-glutamylcyclotransferase (GGCT)/AIG2-like uncharacterized protein YtfP
LPASEHPDWYEPLPVFVYGTLRRGFANHDRFCFDVLEVVPAWATGRLYDLPYGFPAMVPARDGRAVGELLTFPDPVAALRRLDQLEGFRPDGPRHYDRIVVEARPLDGGEPVRAWCYVYGAEKIAGLAGRASEIASGAWSPP